MYQPITKQKKEDGTTRNIHLAISTRHLDVTIFEPCSVFKFMGTHDRVSLDNILHTNKYI